MGAIHGEHKSSSLYGVEELKNIIRRVDPDYNYALIEKALASRGCAGGKRFLIILGAWHKYWFLEKLRKRDDLRVVGLSEFL